MCKCISIYVYMYISACACVFKTSCATKDIAATNYWLEATPHMVINKQFRRFCRLTTEVLKLTTNLYIHMHK